MFSAGIRPGFEIHRVFQSFFSVNHQLTPPSQSVADEFRAIAVETPPRKQDEIESAKLHSLPAKIPRRENQLQPASPRSAGTEIETFNPICIWTVSRQIVAGNLHQESNVRLRGGSPELAEKCACQDEIADSIGPDHKNAFGLYQ